MLTTNGRSGRRRGRRRSNQETTPKPSTRTRILSSGSLYFTNSQIKPLLGKIQAVYWTSLLLCLFPTSQLVSGQPNLRKYVPLAKVKKVYESNQNLWNQSRMTSNFALSLAVTTCRKKLGTFLTTLTSNWNSTPIKIPKRGVYLSSWTPSAWSRQSRCDLVIAQQYTPSCQISNWTVELTLWD